ncbi:hypothetical protein [Furfurilactobacillus entadae]|uniref:hypothetical protein n=1 Tax=Furfurilactobacillus entadae TaxID=2922307 RepID=UPI0035E55A29
MSASTIGQQIIVNLLATYLYALGLPLLFSWALTVINRNTKQLFTNKFGVNAPVYFGALGIILHELSHLIMALIFGHRIESFKLLQRATATPDDPDNLTLGYVNHRWHSDNSYQVIGNFFIGFAPIVGISLVIFALTAWLLPDVYGNWVTFAQQPSFGALFHAPVTTIAWGPLTLRLLIWMVLVTNISAGGFDLSQADLKNSVTGLSTYILLLGLIGLATGMLSWPIASWFRLHLVPLYLAISFVVVLSILINAMTRLLFKRH